MKLRLRPSGGGLLAAAVLVAVAAALAVPALVDRDGASRDETRPRAGSRRPAPSSGSSVFRFYQENPTTLDPALASDSYSSSVVAQIYSPLVGLTSDLEPTPQIAESWTISRDGRRYVFHIRPGVHFHHGREVTAHDFEYSLTRVFREPFRSQGLAANYLDAIAGVAEFTSGKTRKIRGIRALEVERLHQGTPQQKALAEDVRGQGFTRVHARGFRQTDLHHLARVGPLVHRGCDVQSLVALQADQ